MTVTYRPPDDIGALAALGRAAFIETFGSLYRPEDLAAFLDQTFGPAGLRREFADPAYAFRIAEADGVPIAYCKVGPLSVPIDPGVRRAIELRQLYVLRAFHGMGVADALMDWALASARARQADDLYLSVYAGNHRARRFYARHGFVEVGRYQFMVGAQADDERILRLELAR